MSKHHSRQLHVKPASTLALWVLTAALAFVTAGCASSQREDVYSRDQAQRAQTVENGTVQSVRPVQIEGTKSGIGAAAGGIGGAIAGGGVGDGRGAGVMSVIGGLLGGLAGAAGEEAATRKDGIEVIVDLDDGRTLAVVQELQDDLIFEPGQRVRVIRGQYGQARVTR